MRNRVFFFMIPLLIFACNDATETDTTLTEDEENTMYFETFDEKISYCIGLDNGFTIMQVYNGPKTAGKFDLTDIEAGLIDYLGDGELRLDINSVDSVLQLYLLEDGQVDDSRVSKQEASYAIGLVEGQTLVGSMVGRGIDQKMDIENLLGGIKDGIKGSEKVLSLSEARNEVSAYYSEMNQVMGADFLEKNAQNEGVIVTESGLQYEVFKEGSGLRPNLTDSVLVHYTGRFIDGRVFETTIPSQHPISFTPMGVIQGWQEGLLLMKEGGSARFFIPYQMAYGASGSGMIEPFSTLVFDIELLKVTRFKS